MLAQVIAISMLLVSIHWKPLYEFAMLWMWGVVFFGVISAIQYFVKFWLALDAGVKIFDHAQFTGRTHLPHMGWNEVWQAQPHALWAGIPDGSFFYFVHSYHARTSDARHSVGEADYGGRFTAAIARDNIFATQFHPEKSAQHGLALYRNFLTWQP